MKLQDAFISENGDKIGDFTAIGYEMQQTQTFDYVDGVTPEDGVHTVALAETDPAWYAKSRVALNDCPKDVQWELKLEASSSGNGAKWTASYSANETECAVLTPRFKDLTRGN